MAGEDSVFLVAQTRTQWPFRHLLPGGLSQAPSPRAANLPDATPDSSLHLLPGSAPTCAPLELTGDGGNGRSPAKGLQPC